MIIILIIIFSSMFYFNLKKQLIIDDFINSSISTKNKVNQYIKLSCDYINLLSIYGNDYMNSPNYNIDTKFYDLMYDKVNNSYTLDKAFQNGYSKTVGNLTGKGNIPNNPLIIKELSLALSYNKYFHSIFNTLPGLTWIYYTSINEFINIYPWVPSSEFKYSDILHKKEFYTGALPEINKEKKAFWTPIYNDAAGQGNMVTISAPIYYGKDFLGVVSLDITTNKLNSILNSKYNSFLLNEYSQIVGSNFNNQEMHNRVLFINDLLKKYKDNELNILISLPDNKLMTWKNNYIYKLKFIDAPWELYLILPVSKVIYEALIAILPILVIGIFLIILSYEIDIRRKAQNNLKSIIEELAITQNLLHRSASHDFLTSLLNRRGLFEKLDILLSDKNLQKEMSIILADIDFFKKVNDSYGHSVGDTVLISVAKTIEKLVCNNDMVVRWGGEEFLIVLPNTQYEAAMKKAKEIRYAIEKTTIKHNSIELNITMTFGVSKYDSSVTIDQCISNADKALYFGKNNGRNCVVGYEEMDS